MHSFGRSLGWFRNMSGKDAAEVAAVAGVSEADILGWESGEAATPDVATVDRLELALDLPEKTLLYALAWPILPTDVADVDTHQLWRLCLEVRDVLAWAADDDAPVVSTRWLDEDAGKVEVHCGAPLEAVPAELAPELDFAVEADGVDAPAVAVFSCKEHGHRIVLPVS